MFVRVAPVCDPRIRFRTDHGRSMRACSKHFRTGGALRAKGMGKSIAELVPTHVESNMTLTVVIVL